MKKILDAVKWFFSNPTCVFVLGLVVVLLATSMEVFRGRNTNYFDYQDSTRMFWEGLSPYNLEYAQAQTLDIPIPFVGGASDCILLPA